MNLDDIPKFSDASTLPEASSLVDAVESLDRERAKGPDAAADLIGLSLSHCINEMLEHPELEPRVRKIVCGREAPKLTRKGRELAERLYRAGKVYVPHLEGRAHQMPQGNAAHGGLPSRWWITNTDYRKVLTGKLRAIMRDMKERGLM